ncbi:class GN sortase [Pseudocolwellia sp. HL-MZ19]|uniref:class GN sortase n=1 Tax=unclassified Pseudocolwellia TaxID=2848178 RepID=UPI003CEA5F40
MKFLFNQSIANSLNLRFCSIILCGVSFLIIAHSMYLPAKAWLSQELIAYSWEVTQTTKEPSPPWPWADTTAIAKMDIERLNKSMVLLKGTDPTTLAFSAGVMHQYSTLSSNRPFVIAGHRDTHFSFLQDVQMEDVIKLGDINGNTQRYRVESIEIIDSDKTPLLLDMGEPELLLITCYPFNAMRAGGSLRYVVKAKKLNEMIG